jgi:hypothetical protein
MKKSDGGKEKKIGFSNTIRVGMFILKHWCSNLQSGSHVG